MKVDTAQLTKLMKMVRLDLLEDEKIATLKALDDMVQWLAKLGQLETKAVAPLITMSQEKNQFGGTQPRFPINLQQALSNAPAHDGTYFHLPAKQDAPQQS